VLAQKQRNLAVVPVANLLDQPLLQRQCPIKRDRAEQERFEGWRSGHRVELQRL
jgi:hypothetical protein